MLLVSFWLIIYAFIYITFNNNTCVSEKPPTTPAPGDGMCQRFAIPYGKYCYYVYSGDVGFSWPDSEHYCQAGRMELVSIHSRAEVEFLKSFNYSKNMNLWIGLTRDNNCEFTNGKKKRETRCFHRAIVPGLNSVKWINFSFKPAVGWAWTDETSVSFLNWAPNEPNSAFHLGDMAENCVEMYKDGRWNDNNCMEKKSFACRHPQCKHFSHFPF